MSHIVLLDGVYCFSIICDFLMIITIWKLFFTFFIRWRLVFFDFFTFFVRWRLVNNWFSQFKKNSLQSILKCHKNSWRLFFVIISGVTQKFSGFSLCSFATWSTPLVFEYFSSEWFFSIQSYVCLFYMQKPFVFCILATWVTRKTLDTGNNSKERLLSSLIPLRIFIPCFLSNNCDKHE